MHISKFVLATACLVLASCSTSELAIDGPEGIPEETVLELGTAFLGEHNASANGQFTKAYSYISQNCDPELTLDHFTLFNSRYNDLFEVTTGIAPKDVELSRIEVLEVDGDRAVVQPFFATTDALGEVIVGGPREYVLEDGSWRSWSPCGSAELPIPDEIDVDGFLGRTGE